MSEITGLLSNVEMTEIITASKFIQGRSGKDIFAAAGLSDGFVGSACLGQNAPPVESADNVAAFPDLGSRLVRKGWVAHGLVYSPCTNATAQMKAAR